MVYRQIIKLISSYSGFSDQEAETALCLFTEILAARLTSGERKDFASQLPKELKDVALDMPPEAVDASIEDVYETLSELQDIDRARAKKQVMAAWHGLKAALDQNEVQHIQAQLPNEMVAEIR